MQNHIKKNHAEKAIEFRRVFFTLIHHIHQIMHQVIFIFFILYQMLWMIKNFLQKYQMKTSVESFLSWRSAKFYLKRIN